MKSGVERVTHVICCTLEHLSLSSPRGLDFYFLLPRTFIDNSIINYFCHLLGSQLLDSLYEHKLRCAIDISGSELRKNINEVAGSASIWVTHEKAMKTLVTTKPRGI